MHMPSLYIYIIMFQDAWLTQVHRKKDGGRKPKAEENQGVDMIRKMGKDKK